MSHLDSSTWECSAWQRVRQYIMANRDRKKYCSCTTFPGETGLEEKESWLRQKSKEKSRLKGKKEVKGYRNVKLGQTQIKQSEIIMLLI